MTIYELFIQDLATDRRLEVPVHGLPHSAALLTRMEELVAAGEAEECPGWPPTIRFNSVETLRRIITGEQGLTLGTAGDPHPGRPVTSDDAITQLGDGGPFEAIHYEV